MENQKSMWWPVALLGVVMLASIIAGVYNLIYFIFGAIVWIVLLFVIIVVIEAKSGAHKHSDDAKN